MNAGNMQCFGLQKYLKQWPAILAGLMVVIAANRPSFGQCGNDNDCKGDRICVSGECVDPTPASGLTAPAVDTVRLEPSQPEPSPVVETVGETVIATPQVEEIEKDDYEDEEESIPEPGFWDIWFNPIGFVQFGPTAGVEFRTVPNLYVGLHGRYAAMGMLYNLLLEGRANEEDYEVGSIEVYPNSFGVGVEFKYYITFPSRPHMLYFGMFSEYMQGGYTAFNDNDYYYSSSSSGSLIPQKRYEAVHRSIGLGAALGHRWRFGPTKKVLLHVGLLTGVAHPFESTKAFYGTTTANRTQLGPTQDLPHKNEFIFMAEVGIGYGM